jgi:large subunit ribosomal protein L4e
MFAPTKTFRKWTVSVPKKLRRYAICSALAATALPALVMARGHKVDEVPEFPLVVSDGIEGLQKTKEAVALLTKLGAGADVQKVANSTKVRPGKGKWRNRRYINRKGPLIVYKEKNGVEQAFRNLPGVDTAPISALNILQLAPGGHLGRFIIWSESAIKELDAMYGTDLNKACPKKRNFRLPRSMLTTSDVTRVINSTEIKAAVRPKRRPVKRSTMSHNPLKNRTIMAKLNPHSVNIRNEAKLANNKKKTISRSKRRGAVVKARRALPAK